MSFIKILSRTMGICLVFFSLWAHADYVSTSCYSPLDKKAFPLQSIQLISGGCIGYIIKPTQTSPHKIIEFPFVGSGKLAFNKQGNGVVMLQNYLSGRLDRKNNKIFGGVLTQQENPVAVYTYWDHKLTGKIKYSEFIDETKPVFRSIRESVSHIGFVKTHSFRRDGKILTITNYADKKYQVHLPSGRIL